MALHSPFSADSNERLTTRELSEATEPSQAKVYRLSRLTGGWVGANPNRLSYLESSAYLRKWAFFSADVCVTAPCGARFAERLTSRGSGRPTEPDWVKPCRTNRVPPNRRRRTRIRYLPCFQPSNGKNRPFFGEMYESPVSPRQPSLRTNNSLTWSQELTHSYG